MILHSSECMLARNRSLQNWMSCSSEICSVGLLRLCPQTPLNTKSKTVIDVCCHEDAMVVGSLITLSLHVFIMNGGMQSFGFPWQSAEGFYMCWVSFPHGPHLSCSWQWCCRWGVSLPLKSKPSSGMQGCSSAALPWHVHCWRPIHNTTTDSWAWVVFRHRNQPSIPQIWKYIQATTVCHCINKHQFLVRSEIMS